MNPFQEKLTMCGALITSAMVSGMGAILSAGEIRWFCVTGFLSTILSGFLALMFKAPQDTMKLTVARCGISVFGGIFMTQMVVWWWDIKSAETSVISLGGISCVVCAFWFTVGFAGLKYLEKKSDYFAKRFIDSKVVGLLPADLERP